MTHNRSSAAGRSHPAGAAAPAHASALHQDLPPSFPPLPTRSEPFIETGRGRRRRESEVGRGGAGRWDAVAAAEAAGRVAGLFRGLGAGYVGGVAAARDLALVEACAEHAERCVCARTRAFLCFPMCHAVVLVCGCMCVCGGSVCVSGVCMWWWRRFVCRACVRAYVCVCVGGRVRACAMCPRAVGRAPRLSLSLVARGSTRICN